MSDSLPEAVFHIYPTDCDMLGHMNHASMLELMERARWALMDHRVRIEDVVREIGVPGGSARGHRLPRQDAAG